jgi:hypothetical protein
MYPGDGINYIFHSLIIRNILYIYIQYDLFLFGKNICLYFFVFGLVIFSNVVFSDFKTKEYWFKAKAWGEGQNIPTFLLNYQPPCPHYMYCENVSFRIYTGIRNYKLLLNIIKPEDVDENITDLAAITALNLVGIKQFLSDMDLVI